MVPRRRSLLALLLVSLPVLASCGGGSKSSGAEVEKPPVPVSSGLLEGVVAHGGQASPAPPISRADCGDLPPEGPVRLGPDGGLASVVVQLAGVPPLDAPEGELVLSARGCRFEPRVSVVPVGTVLQVRNAARGLRTFHLWSRAEDGSERSLQDLVVPPGAGPLNWPLDTAGLVHVTADDGPMEAWIHVGGEGRSAVTDAGGSFAFSDLPLGSWDARLWHESLGRRSARVELSSEKGRAELSY